MRQGILTIVAPIADGAEGSIKEKLEAFEEAKPLRLLDDLHCGSFSIVSGDAFPPHLVFEVSFDGTREEFVDDLVTQIPEAIDRIFRYCADYPRTGPGLPQVLKNYLLDHDVGADTLYIAFPGRTVGQILEETSLRDEVVGTLDRIRRAVPRDQDESSKRSLVDDLRRHIRGLRPFAGLLTPAERPFLVAHGAELTALVTGCFKVLAIIGFALWLRDYGGSWLQSALFPSFWVGLPIAARLAGALKAAWPKISGLVVIAALAYWLHRTGPMWLRGATAWLKQGLFAVSHVVFIAAVVLIAIVIVWVLIVQLQESFDVPDPTQPSFDSAHEEKLRRMENLTTQNNLVGFNRLKPGVVRLWTLRLVLWLIDLDARLVDNRGSLGGISSIHFARWVIIRGHGGTHWLLFLSHYDGDWGGYLSDFVTLVPSGMTAIWSNCVGFPRSWFLVGGGVKDERTFKGYARKSQRETLHKYSPYEHLSVGDIDNHGTIRTALGRSLDGAGVDALMQRL
jgi:hypothetical protein